MTPPLRGAQWHGSAGPPGVLWAGVLLSACSRDQPETAPATGNGRHEGPCWGDHSGVAAWAAAVAALGSPSSP
eukprot:3574044-Pyramimonas_sp.AAC.1